MFALLISVFSGCQEVASFDDVIMFTGTENSPVIKFVVEEPRSMGLTVSATDRVSKDTRVKLSIVKELLQTYNESTGRSYVLPPEGTYDLEQTETVIKEGETVSEAVRFTLKSFEGFEEGKIYCVPVTITETDGDMKVLESSRTVYVVINRTIVTKAVNLGGRCGFNVPLFMTDTRVHSLGAVTMEIRVRVNGWAGSNPYISSLMGIEENFLFRFGDISIKPNQLQLAPALIGGKKYFTTGNTMYQTNKWHQVVCVYNGGAVSIYVDGNLDVSFKAGPGNLNLNDNYFDGFWFGQSCGGRYLNGAISEARFWTKALTMQEIQDNACYVDPKTPGLLAYWRFNAVQEDGKTVKDETGNGFDAIAHGSFSWVEGIKCPY